MPRITELWLYVMSDTADDDEGVPTMPGPRGSIIPLFGADKARAESLRPYAQRMARSSGKPIKLIKSTGIEVVETIEP